MIIYPLSSVVFESESQMRLIKGVTHYQSSLKSCVHHMILIMCNLLNTNTNNVMVNWIRKKRNGQQREKEREKKTMPIIAKTIVYAEIPLFSLRTTFETKNYQTEI